MQLVGDGGWNSRSGSMVLFLVICCLLCTTCRSNPIVCVLRLNGNDHNCAGDVQQIIVEHGRNAKLFCSLHQCWANRECHSGRVSDLEVLIDNKVVERSNLQVRQPDAIMMFTGTLPPAKYSFDCRLRLGTVKTVRKQYRIIWKTQLIIGSKPTEPRNFKCVSHDGGSLVCTWEPVPNAVDTRFSLRFKNPKPIGGTSFICPGSQSPNSCQWRPSKIPPSKLTAEYYTLVLEAENLLGKEEYTYKYHHWANVVPPKPLKISVVDTTSSNAQLHWNAPLSLRVFPPGMHYRVRYQRQNDSSKTWHTIDVKNETQSNDVYLNLPDLEYDDATYNVELYAKSSMAVGEDMWSQFSDTTFTTKPCSTPKSISGSFEFVGANDNRDVFIYWREGPADRTNEEKSMYHVVGFAENGQRSNVEPDEITKGHAVFRGISSDGWKFEITSNECKSANSRKATVHVPGQSAVPQKPDVFTTVALDGGIFEVSWNQYPSSDITNYTIFWCEKNESRPNECTGELEWLHVPRDTNIYNITVPDPKKSYRFAIAANTAQTSSGMTWFSDVTIPGDVVGKVDSIRPIRIDSNEVEVGWKLDYSGRIGVIEGFKVYYCPTLSPNTPTCNGPEMFTSIPSHPYTTNGIIGGLKPDTQYVLTVVVSSNKGEGLPSDKFYFTTDQVPFDPRIAEIIGNSISELKDSMTLANENAKVLDRKLNEMYGLVSTIANFTGEVLNLKAAISALERSSTDMKNSIREINARNEAVDRKLDEIKTTAADSATKVSDLSQSTSALVQSSADVKDSIGEMKERNEAVDRKLNGIDALDSKITESAAQVLNLTQTVFAIAQKSNGLEDFIRETKERDEAFDRKLDEVNKLGSAITASAAGVSDLKLAVTALGQGFTEMKDSIEDLKNRNEAVDNKLDGIDVLSTKITDTATQVSNLTQTIYAFKDHVVSEENCELRNNLTTCTNELSHFNSLAGLIDG